MRTNLVKVSEEGNFAQSNPSLDSLTISTITNGPRGRIMIRDTKEARWEVPHSLFPRGDLGLQKEIKSETTLRVNVSQDPFSFSVEQAGSQFSRTIFDSSSA